MKKLDYLIVAELFMTPTAKFADLLLPVTSAAERNDLARPWPSGPYFAAVNQAIAPVGECKSDLEIAVALGAEHISAYLLETDKETPLAGRLRSKELEEPDQETISALYRMTEEWLPEMGFRRYEVSNWARSGRESRHNLGYWEDRPYLGFGSSAHSYTGDSGGPAASRPRPISPPFRGMTIPDQDVETKVSQKAPAARRVKTEA